MQCETHGRNALLLLLGRGVHRPRWLVPATAPRYDVSRRRLVILREGVGLALPRAGGAGGLLVFRRFRFRGLFDDFGRLGELVRDGRGLFKARFGERFCGSRGGRGERTSDVRFSSSRARALILVEGASAD